MLNKEIAKEYIVIPAAYRNNSLVKSAIEKIKLNQMRKLVMDITALLELFYGDYSEFSQDLMSLIILENVDPGNLTDIFRINIDNRYENDYQLISALSNFGLGNDEELYKTIFLLRHMYFLVKPTIFPTCRKPQNITYTYLMSRTETSLLYREGILTDDEIAALKKEFSLKNKNEITKVNQIICLTIKEVQTVINGVARQYGRVKDSVYAPQALSKTQQFAYDALIEFTLFSDIANLAKEPINPNTENLLTQYLNQVELDDEKLASLISRVRALPQNDTTRYIINVMKSLSDSLLIHEFELAVSDTMTPEEINNTIVKIEKYMTALSRIDRSSSWYTQAQYIRANILQACLANIDLCDKLLSMPTKLFFAIPSSMSGFNSIEILDSREKILFESIDAYFQSEEKGILFFRKSLISLLAELQRFQSRETKEILPSEEISAPDHSNQKTESELCERDKTEEELPIENERKIPYSFPYLLLQAKHDNINLVKAHLEHKDENRIFDNLNEIKDIEVYIEELLNNLNKLSENTTTIYINSFFNYYMLTHCQLGFFSINKEMEKEEIYRHTENYKEFDRIYKQISPDTIWQRKAEFIRSNILFSIQMNELLCNKLINQHFLLFPGIAEAKATFNDLGLLDAQKLIMFEAIDSLAHSGQENIELCRKYIAKIMIELHRYRTQVAIESCDEEVSSASDGEQAKHAVDPNNNNIKKRKFAETDWDNNRNSIFYFQGTGLNQNQRSDILEFGYQELDSAPLRTTFFFESTNSQNLDSPQVPKNDPDNCNNNNI